MTRSSPNPSKAPGTEPFGAEESASGSLVLKAMPVVFVLLWSTGFIGAKFGLPYAEPLTFLLIRFAIVAVILVPAALLLRATWPATWQGYADQAVTGLLVHAGYLGAIFAAIDYGLSAGLAALIAGMQPLLTAVVVGRLLGERVTLRQWGGFVLGFAGVVLVVTEKLIGTGAGFDGFGLFLAVCALVSITLGTVYQKRRAGGVDLRSGTAIQYVAATVALLIFAPMLETMEVDWTGEFIFAVFWLVFVLSIGAISLLMIMIRKGEVARVASFFYLVPPVTALTAWLMFDEHLGLMALAGMAVAVMGVALVITKGR